MSNPREYRGVDYLERKLRYCALLKARKVSSWQEFEQLELLEPPRKSLWPPKEQPNEGFKHPDDIDLDSYAPKPARPRWEPKKPQEPDQLEIADREPYW